MADVFISYCRQERPLTAELAAQLMGRGHSVWWDTDLLPHQNFRNEIDRQLDLAKAVVIIWTPTSMKSEWVRAEADHAHRQRKLINTCAGISPLDLPKPFSQTHAVAPSDYLAIFRAIAAIGTLASPARVSPGQHFITQAIAEALVRANDLMRLATLQPWVLDDQYVSRMIEAAERVEEPLRLFRDGLPYPELKTYANRVVSDRIDRATEPLLREVQSEINWMTKHRHSLGVISGARGDLSGVVTTLLELGPAPIIHPESAT